MASATSSCVGERVSLRSRLAVSFALVAAIVTAITGVVVYELSARDLVERARAAVGQEAETARAYQEQNGLPRAGDLATAAPVVPSPLAAAIAAGKVATYVDVTTQTAWAGLPPTAAIATPLFVHRSFADDAAALSYLGRILVGVGVASAAGGALLGILLANQLSRRIRQAASVATLVAAGDLDARVGSIGRDEVGELGRAVDDMAASLQRRLEHERRFVADVAHDLRTPLTGLVTAAELLERDQVGLAIRGRVRHLRDLVEDLLEIARLDAGAATPDLRRVELARFLEPIIDRHPGTTLVVPPTPVTAIVDPRRLERIVENLLQNATRHGAPPVSVTVSSTSFAVRDHGPGFSAAMLAGATDRFRSGDASRRGGVGLGLSIVAAQTTVLGGTLRVENAPDGGGLVTVTLPDVVA